MLGLRVLNQIQLIEVVFIDNTENSPYMMNSPQISTRLRDCPPEQVGCSLLWAKRAAKRAAKPCSRDGRCWPGTLGRGGGWPRCLGRTQTVVTLGGDCMVCGVLCTRGGIMPPTPGVTGHNLATLKPLNANIEG